MPSLLPGAISLFLGTVIVNALMAFHVNPAVIHTLIVIAAVFLLFFLNSASIPFVREHMPRNGRWLLLFLTALVVQLIVISTGSIRSPFFILFHLAMFGISFLFSFQIAVLFMISTVFILLGDNFYNHTFTSFFAEDPGTTILYIVSYLTVIPFAYAIAQRYHVKDEITKLLSNQIEAEEAILQAVEDMIFVTDRETRILSINDAVERILHQSRSELLNKPIFDVLYLKDKRGTLLNKKYLPLALLTDDSKWKYDDLSLFTTTVSPTRTVSLQIRPVVDMDGNNGQLTFILTDNARMSGVQQMTTESEEARVKRDAMIAELKRRLHALGKRDLEARLIILAKTDQDIERLQALQNKNALSAIRLDLAKLCRETVVDAQDFANAFNTGVTFGFANFGEDDIAPLVTKVISVKPDQLTGPFFTISADVKHVSFLIQKLIDVGILLTSTEKKADVSLIIERKGTQVLNVQISATSPHLSPHDVEDLWVRYYGNLSTKTNLRLASGLEGYLAKTTADLLHIPLSAIYHEASSQLVFELIFATK